MLIRSKNMKNKCFFVSMQDIEFLRKLLCKRFFKHLYKVEYENGTINGYSFLFKTFKENKLSKGKK